MNPHIVKASVMGLWPYTLNRMNLHIAQARGRGLWPCTLRRVNPGKLQEPGMGPSSAGYTARPWRRGARQNPTGTWPFRIA